jgi:hypothetical protein
MKELEIAIAADHSLGIDVSYVPVRDQDCPALLSVREGFAGICLCPFRRVAFFHSLGTHFHDVVSDV